MIRFGAVALIMLTACAVPGSQVSDGPGLSGVYVVNGVDPLGFEYSGTVTITDDEGDIDIQWLITGAILEGSGKVLGDTLEVDWSAVEAPRGDSTGTATYEITDDGRLVGTRTVDGVDGVGTEEIFPEG
ncbi:MAG: hypothetical protein OEX04_18495 [Acidimicrobiia bacterium]|nr:hypothetical protein [Acidimicrobiia bacterium]MDH4309465.1 hypothetical protein [Acidimicrobiia bacterium]